MKTVPRGILAFFVVMLLILLTGGIWFFCAQEQQLRHKVEAELQSIAQLKVNQIVQWREERLADGQVLTENPFASQIIAQWLASPNQANSEQILVWFRARQKNYHYADIMLVDTSGTILLSLSGQTGKIEAGTLPVLDEALREGRSTLSDLHRAEKDGTPYQDTVAPILADGGKRGLGVIVLRSDTHRFLYPMIQSWPGESNSGETLLVRRDGDEILYLNELRHRQKTALQLRLPLSRKEVPAVKAVNGARGVVTGPDYRGSEVMAVLSTVPGTPWFMVTKIDTAEALAEWRVLSFLIVGLLLGLGAAMIAALGMAWQRYAKKQYQTALQAEAERRHAEAQYRTTLMSVGDGVIVCDREGRVTLLNPVAEVLTGWLQEDARGKPIAEVFVIVSEETRLPAENPVARVLHEGLVVGLANHTILITPAGAEFPIADSGAPIFDNQGRITGVVLVFRDQTKERNAEAELRQTHHLLERAEEMASIGWWEFDLKRRTVWASASARRIYGLKNEDWTIEAVQTLPLPEYRHDLDRALNGLVHNNEAYDVEFRILRPTDGAIVDIRSQAEYHAEEGKVFGVIHDITEQKQTEEKHEQLQAQLMQAQKLESVGRLAGGVAHDLNNLLSPILGYSDILLAELSEHDTRRQYVQYIVQAGTRAGDLIRQLLAFGRKQTLLIKNVDLNEIIEGFAKLLMRAVREDIVIEIVATPGLPTVQVDVGQIEQVLMNLVVNAQDAIPEGGTILIKTAITDLDQEYATAHAGVTPGRYVVMEVTDNGFGMNAEVCEQIFVPFFTTKEKGKGTGLGLATTYGIVKQHHGHIWVYSEPGQGTTFKIYLPAAESAPALKLLEPAAPQQASSGSEIIMVVEDNDMVRQMTVDMLTRRGYTVFEASGGAACLQMLRNHPGPLDLLITDVVMPEMNGKMLYKEAEQLIPGLKVLYMSGYTENVIASRGVLDHGVNFIEKPFTPNGLAAKVRAVLEG